MLRTPTADANSVQFPGGSTWARSDTILVAAAEAQKKAAEAASQVLSKATGGLDMPFKLPGF